MTRHRRIFITQTRQEGPKLIDDLINGTEPAATLGHQEALELLQALVPTFKKVVVERQDMEAAYE